MEHRKTPGNSTSPGNLLSSLNLPVSEISYLDGNVIPLKNLFLKKFADGSIFLNTSSTT
jgi:hypothetical protein